MNCPTCNHLYTTQAYLPIIQQTGNTQCLQCFINKNANFQNLELSKLNVNKELIKMMGRCPQHKEIVLTLFDVKTKKRHCHKCVIFSKDRKKFGACRFVEIDQKNNKIDKVLQTKMQNVQINLKQIQKQILNTSQNQKQSILNQTKKKLNQIYNQMIKSLKQSYQKQNYKIFNSIQTIYQKFIQESFVQYNIIKKQSSKMLQNSNTNKIYQKYDKIADLVNFTDQLNKLKPILIIKSQNFSKKLREFSHQYQCSFTMEIKDNKKVKNIKILQQRQQQILIDLQENIQVAFIQQKPYINFSNEKFEQKSIQSIPSTQMTNLSQSHKKVVKNPIKNTFVIGQISDINKIQTQIKQIQAIDLSVTNTDAKNILNLVSKSFVKCLDLSGNKITNAFLKDLTKANIGKYLKTIRLHKNDININDASIVKKIQQLKLQGVNIIV